MNILFINDIPFNPKYGGVERVTDLLAKGLIGLNKGYKVFYLNFKTNNKDMLNYDFPAECFELPEYGDLNIEVNKEFIYRIIKDYHIDIVINQRGEMSMMNLEFISSKSKIISVIHSIVDVTWRWMYYKSKYHHDKTIVGYLRYIIKKITWPLYSKKIKQKAQLLIKTHFANLANASKTIVLLSDSYIPKFKEYVGDCTVAITAIPNPNTFDVQKIDYSSKEKIVLYVGRLSLADKNPIRLLQIWRELHNSHPDWRLVLVGGGPEEIALQKYIDKYQLRNVSLEGARQNVIDYYRRSSIVCLVSNYEGWGMTLTEGMTFGCVPFTFGNYGAAYDIIDDGVNGCIISAFNIKHYACCLSEIMSDDNKRLTMGQAAQEKAKQFSAEKIVERWDRLFNSL